VLKHQKMYVIYFNRRNTVSRQTGRLDCAMVVKLEWEFSHHYRIRHQINWRFSRLQIVHQWRYIPDKQGMCRFI